ncbi:MAG: 3-hydroxyacyl-CoA dehydrogenase/enoyl-CoA hydratase family protein [Alphaproteobacteria bacterium]
MKIERAAVIGAGVMGAGIAAHFANAGVKVLLLDVVVEGADDRNALAAGAIRKMLKSQPAPFMTKGAAKLVTPGNLEDDFDRLAEADWIVEAVIEDLEIKRRLYRRIDKVRKPGSVVSSNTSTLPLATLTKGLPAGFAADFLIAHFFNPPRYMRLLELVGGPKTRRDAVDAVRRFADERLGKGVVMCHDTPSFIANRIGSYWIRCAVVEALDRGLTVEEADALMGRPLGIPKTGVFGLLDLVGVDLLPHVDRSLADALPEGDAYHDIRRPLPIVDKMIADGLVGRKGKGGFYRLNAEGVGRVKEAIDLRTGAYNKAARPALESLDASKAGGLRALVEHQDRGGRYAWAVVSKTLAYAASLVPEIADDVHAVDRAMRLGYNWQYGPFELIDQLGAAYLAERLAREGEAIPALLAMAGLEGGFYRVDDGRRQFLGLDGSWRDVERPDGVLLLADVKLRAEPMARNGSASLWDVGDGVACLEVHTKLNAVDPDVLAMMRKAIDIVAADHKALVIYNEGEQFSAGANLGIVLFAANIALWPMIEDAIGEGQKTLAALSQAPFPVVAAPSGLALGGGCEILLHADAVQAHTESYIGLVEAGVGVVPAWGGCTKLLTRLAADPARPKGPMPPVATAFETIAMAKVATSAHEARELGFLRADDGIIANRERLLADAKARALAMVEGYAPSEPADLVLPGRTGKAALGLAVRDFRAKGDASEHDARIADALADVLTGGADADMTQPVPADRVMALERESFMRLIRTEKTLARIEHTLETGKPLRN